MRYQLDTVPVWDAYKTPCQCPMCLLRAQNEQQYIENFLGASVMEPATRVEVNEKGFCNVHLKMLFDEKNRLGVALMMHSHLREMMKVVAQARKKALSGSSEGGFKLFGGGKEGGSAAYQSLHAHTTSCVLCDRLSNTMDRYFYTLIHLYANDKDFAKVFAQSQGLCLPDMALAVKMAQEQFSQKQAQAFLTALFDLQEKSLAALEKDLEWFTLKFDYRNGDKPWGDSKDAPERTINKLRGHGVGQPLIKKKQSI